MLFGAAKEEERGWRAIETDGERKKRKRQIHLFMKKYDKTGKRYVKRFLRTHIVELGVYNIYLSYI